MTSDTAIRVLDHGLIRLVSYMQPVPTDDSLDDWTGDLEVIRNARTSYDADWRTGEDAGKDAKLINYLYKNRHTSPFESMVFTFEIKCPLFVARQWHRHRTWAYSEISARYTELPEEFYVPDNAVLTTQSTSNKQMRTNELLPPDVTHLIRNGILEQNKEAFKMYQVLLEQKCPREIARSVLPVGTYTRYFGTVNLHNLFHFLRLRLHEHSQYEIRVYAEAMMQLIEPIVPEALKAFKNTL